MSPISLTTYFHLFLAVEITIEQPDLKRKPPAEKGLIPQWFKALLSVFLYGSAGYGVYKIYGTYQKKQEREASMERLKDDKYVKASTLFNF